MQGTGSRGTGAEGAPVHLTLLAHFVGASPRCSRISRVSWPTRHLAASLSLHQPERCTNPPCSLLCVGLAATWRWRRRRRRRSAASSPRVTSTLLSSSGTASSGSTTEDTLHRKELTGTGNTPWSCKACPSACSRLAARGDRSDQTYATTSLPARSTTSAACCLLHLSHGIRVMCRASRGAPGHASNSTAF